jgi:predicted membrane channel-forming protein YqfA (hemolysin III family)
VAGDKIEKIPLSEAVTHILEECRMVLPGIQALFGFQLIVVFNPAFHEKLSSTERWVHLIAIGLIIIAIALVMAPAAYHRQKDPQAIREDFIFIATRLLLYAMFPLTIALALEFFLIARMITNKVGLSIALAVIVASIFSTLWFLLPRSRSLQQFLSSRRE